VATLTLVKKSVSISGRPALNAIVNMTGTYILILRLDSARSAQVGRLGRWVFPKGYYAYVGSAFGPGGLPARLAHHLKPASRPHWHIDYLRRFASVCEVWFEVSAMRLEHRWAFQLQGLPDASMPVKRFGASDCRCGAHLFCFSGICGLAACRRALQKAGARLEVKAIEAGRDSKSVIRISAF
jgi:Uri superfamily endonuclease